MSEVLDENAGSNQRSTFLTVLCILTFIGSGLGVLGGLLGLVGSSALGMFAPQGTMIVQVLGLIAAGLCLYGAIQMWGLKKQGFTMYVAGAAVAIVASIIGALTFGSLTENMSVAMEGMEGLEGLEGFDNAGMAAADSLASSAMWMSVVIAIVINVVFVLMYNANKKQLVK